MASETTSLVNRLYPTVRTGVLVPEAELHGDLTLTGSVRSPVRRPCAGFRVERGKTVLLISAWWSPGSWLCIDEAALVLFLELQIIAEYLGGVMVMRFGNFMPDRSDSFNCWIILH